ncbi:MAG: gluconate 2-dehydrogenase subunit 3 family protein [Gammaproteobacteria bacterium]|nr:gluconate 2-dehydrogenase subunit 3 family protein [Gammaproteobacteria bacterium]
MSKSLITRRDFLRSISDSARHSLVVLSLPSIALATQQARAAQNAGRNLVNLNSNEAAELESIAARIMPTDETPGAREAGVIYFMDNVLGEERSEVLPALRKGLSDLQAVANARFGSDLLNSLSDAGLDTLLAEIEDSSFFGTVRYLTIAGMFTNPVHGGNQEEIGWQLIGFEDNHAWSPPFGYYDAEYMETGE